MKGKFCLYCLDYHRIGASYACGPKECPTCGAPRRPMGKRLCSYCGLNFDEWAARGGAKA